MDPTTTPRTAVQDDSAGIEEEYRRVEEKYRKERDKRLRPDGANQYIEVPIGSAIEADPFAPPPAERLPVTEEIDVLIVGGGYSGLLTAVHLRNKGVNDFRIIEKGADFGGTWYWNRYPGISCDVESYIYLPLLEELGYMPSERYAAGSEILDHARAIGRHYQLYDTALFQTRADDVRWDESDSRWVVHTDRNDIVRARHVVMTTGGLLHRPKLPGIPGLESFEGKWFHASRWDYSFTGGDAKGGLVGLQGKRVAVVGTGATALQVVPHVAEWADHLYVVQRTPSVVDIRANAPTDSEWAASLEPGWQRRRMENFDLLLAGFSQKEDLVNDQWTQLWGFPDPDPTEDGSSSDQESFMRKLRAYDHAQMERVRARVDELVDDPEVAAALKPWYATHCKRPGFHDKYLQTFNRENVTLVDTGGRGLDGISAHAIHVDSTAYDVDCIIYATGFEAAVSPGRAGGFTVRGRNGATLEERWKGAVRSVHGIYSNQFPNLFIVGGLRQAAVSINVLFVNGEQARHVAEMLQHLIQQDVRSFEVTAEAETRWAALMAEKSAYNEESTKACTPSFYNNEGDLEANTPLFAAFYGGGPVEYIDLLAKWRAEGFRDDTTVG
ncbi:flavin-containing monooxygenase [Qaidamihabitans albus]|uniref:flavin-containing monooxygenase n=1 Tax=Qaidamihabitans albus TaxID=2795733 RepID=UPI0018F21CDE|nr:NAD(P)/FAD-dependent oxidoreductase [Qaidamihabitans albus]